MLKNPEEEDMLECTFSRFRNFSVYEINMETHALKLETLALHNLILLWFSEYFNS